MGLARSPSWPNRSTSSFNAGRQNPSPAATIALCDALRETPRAPLVQQVGEFATQRHATDVGVLVSVARMYLESNRFGDAQAVLVAAGKQAPARRHHLPLAGRGAAAPRRRRAGREGARARHPARGARIRTRRLWLERARVFRPMQAKAGTRAVAAEVAHATAHAARPPLDSMSDSTTAVHVRPCQRLAAPRATTSRRARAASRPSRRRAAPPPRSHPSLAAPPVPATPRAAPLRQARPRRRRTAFEPPAAPPMMRAPAPSASGEIEHLGAGARCPTAPAIPKRAGAPFEQPANPFAPLPTNGAPAAAPPPPRAVPALQASAPGPQGPMVPHPRDVLDALALAGVFEPPADRAGAAAAWANARRGAEAQGRADAHRRDGAVPRGQRGDRTSSTGTSAPRSTCRPRPCSTRWRRSSTRASRPRCRAPRRSSSQAFQLESRSPRAALDWTRERALVGLVKSGEDVAFEDAMARAKDVGVPEEKYAFARVASFLFQGDTAGAAAVLPRWDGPAGIDPWYQMVAGATLERAGDAHARDRYATAAQARPGPRRRAGRAGPRDRHRRRRRRRRMRLAQALRKSLPDRAEPRRPRGAGVGARSEPRDRCRLRPRPTSWASAPTSCRSGLEFVPHAVAALRALDKRRRRRGARRDTEGARGRRLARGRGVARDHRAAARRRGARAQGRARRRCSSRRSTSRRARSRRASRCSAAGSTRRSRRPRTWTPTSPDVAVVRAAAAYERVDADGVDAGARGAAPGGAQAALPRGARLAPDALARQAAARRGEARRRMAADDAPWSDLVAMDVALDAGDLASADKIAAGVGQGRREPHALRALRLARLARYEGELDAGRRAVADGDRARDGDAARALGAGVRAGRPQPRQRGGAAAVALPAGARAAGHVAQRLRDGVRRQRRGGQGQDGVGRPAAGRPRRSRRASWPPRRSAR